MVAGIRHSAGRLNAALAAGGAVTVQGLSHDGRGIARLNGKALFIEGALPGEEVSLRLLRRRRSHDEAVVQQVLKAAPERVTPRCAHFGVCGGCTLQHLAPEAQLAAKQQTLLDNLRRIGHVQPETILPPLTGPVWGYRRRARLSAHRSPQDQRVHIGFMEQHQPRVTDTRRCETLHPKIGLLIEPLSALLTELSISDRIPQVEVAVGETDAVLVLRVLSEPSASDRQRLLEFERAQALRFYLQTGRADGSVPLAGDAARLSYRLPDWNLELEFEPTDFIQVNAEMNRALVKLATGLLQVEPDHRVLDLFCGLGNFTLPLARTAKEALGVEGETGLVRRARANAERNGLTNAEFQQADLFNADPQAPWLKQRFDRILLDPPRAGAREIIAEFPRLEAERVVYVSCHPATLARDAGILVAGQGYRLLSAGVLDMFPHTAHVESIAVFARRGGGT